MAGLRVVEVDRPVADFANRTRAHALSPSRTLKRVYRAARTFYDRALHRRRALAARQQVSEAGHPRRILVVCHGNVCRSPYLEARLRQILPSVEVISAGFVGSDRAVPRVAVALGAQRGLDLSLYRSLPLTQSKVSRADFVIVMDAGQARRLAATFRIKRERILIAGDLDQRADMGREIQDPWNGAVEAFEESFDRLDRCAATLANMLRSAK
jgi:protein-tyrosine phosphatase